jgi:hypothetical protein
MSRLVRMGHAGSDTRAVLGLDPRTNDGPARRRRSMLQSRPARVNAVVAELR